MVIQTSRFGVVEVDADRILRFSRGILGFPKHQSYVLIQPEYDSSFYWLQSVDAPDLAFVVTDPLLFVPDYTVPIREETRLELAIEEISDAQVLVIVNKVGDMLTANLQGPLVIHATTRQAVQVVVSEKKYQTRHPIMPVGRAAGKSALSKSA